MAETGSDFIPQMVRLPKYGKDSRSMWKEIRTPDSDIYKGVGFNDLGVISEIMNGPEADKRASRKA